MVSDYIPFEKAARKQLKAAESFYGKYHGPAINKPYPLGKLGQKVADKWAHGLKKTYRKGLTIKRFPKQWKPLQQSKADKIISTAVESGLAMEYEFNADLEIKSKFLKSKAGKGLKAIGKVAKVAGPVGTAYGLYDATKWAMQWHKDNPGYTEQKYKAYGLDINTPGKFGVDY